jgi:hypothetical protein
MSTDDLARPGVDAVCAISGDHPGSAVHAKARCARRRSRLRRRLPLESASASVVTRSARAVL